MKMSEILNHLTFNELSQHAVGGYAQGVMADASIPKVLPIINTGIKDIANRVNLLRDNVVITTSPNITTYQLHPKFSVTGNVPPNPIYLQDSILHPFDVEISRIIDVLDENFNIMPVNVRNDPYSIAQPSYDTLQIPFPLDGEEYHVEFSYVPSTLAFTTFAEALVIDYPLPYFTANALYAYVRKSMTAGISVQQELGESVYALQEYEREVDSIKQFSHVQDDSFLDTRFTRNGFI